MKARREFAIGVFLKAGRLDADRKAIDAELHTWPDGPVTLTLTEGRQKRSKTYEQVKYWWAVPVPLIADHCGYTEAQMHYALMGEWSGYVDGPNGHPIPVKPSLADLSVEEANALIDWVLVWAPSELGVIVPEPNKNWRRRDVA